MALRLAESKKPEEAAAGYALVAIVHHEEHRPGPAVAANERVLELDPRLESLALPPELFFGDLRRISSTLAGLPTRNSI